MTAQDLIDDFAFLDDWEDKYRYVIELGRGLDPLPEDQRTEENKVHGCASQVWLHTTVSDGNGPDPTLSFSGDSDAHIVRGLIAILFAVYSNQPARQILETDAYDVFRSIGLHEHLTPQRSNGFAAMVKRIRSDAEAALSATEVG